MIYCTSLLHSITPHRRSLPNPARAYSTGPLTKAAALVIARPTLVSARAGSCNGASTLLAGVDAMC